MTDREPVRAINLDRYGFPELPWSRPRARLDRGTFGRDTMFFLGTVRPDGRPHAAGVAPVWHDGHFFFTSGQGTRKARNLAADAHCTLSVRLEGIDMVFEGIGARVTDRPTLESVVAMYAAAGDWPARLDGDAITAPFHAPSAGPPPWSLYRFMVHSAIGVATAEPYGATRWLFER